MTTVSPHGLEIFETRSSHRDASRPASARVAILSATRDAVVKRELLLFLVAITTLIGTAFR